MLDDADPERDDSWRRFSRGSCFVGLGIRLGGRLAILLSLGGQGLVLLPVLFWSGDQEAISLLRRGLGPTFPSLGRLDCFRILGGGGFGAV